MIKSVVNSVFGSTYSIPEKLAELRKILEKCDDVESMAATPGWIHIKEVLTDRIALYKDRVFALSADPVKNREEIVKTKALCEAYSGLIELIETTVSKRPELEKKRNSLMQILDKVGLVRDSRPITV